MKKKWDISHAELRKLLHYNPDTGIWTWLSPPTGRHVVGKRADFHYDRGYARLRLVKVEKSYLQCLSHRLAWFYMTGVWPPDEVDHKNNEPSDNRWNNLRLATRTQNVANATRPSHNTSGLKGVSRIKKHPRRWRACITQNKKQTSLGWFDCPAAAYFAYVIAADKTHGAFSSESVR